MNNNEHYVYVVMGVSGSGKSTIASNVAHQLNAAFQDGDFLHPKDNIIKMKNNTPLTDEDRELWFQAIRAAIFAMQQTNKLSFIVCSALKKKYRDEFRKNTKNIRFIYLKGDFETIQKRMSERSNHFFKIQMLVSQFDTLEEPDQSETDVITVDVNKSVDCIQQDILNAVMV